MIALQRDRNPDPTLAKFTGESKRDDEKELLTDQRRIRRNEIAKHKFEDDRWKAATERLIAESGGKCAYCESPTTVVAYGDVEHYRPTSKYWWLAYCYDNYLVSCQLCNRLFKGNRFPYRGAKMRGPRITRATTDAYIESRAGTIAPDPTDLAQVSAFADVHEAEQPLLLNPYFDDPARVFAWQAEDVLREVELVPANAAARPYCRAAERYYGLNRPQLKQYRYQVYSQYRVFRLALDDPGISAATRAQIEQVIAGMQASDAPYAGMIRYFESLS